jgi:two-component system, sensor histidine kinase
MHGNDVRSLGYRSLVQSRVNLTFEAPKVDRSMLLPLLSSKLFLRIFRWRYAIFSVVAGTGVAVAANVVGAYQCPERSCPSMTVAMACLLSISLLAFFKVKQLLRDKQQLETILETVNEHAILLERRLDRLDRVEQMAQEAALESYAKLTQLMEVLHVGVAVLDTKGKICYTNNRAQQILGRGLERPNCIEDIPAFYQIYMTGTEQLYPVDRFIATKVLRGETMRVDNMEIHRDHKIIPIECRGTPVYDTDNQIKYAMLVFEDISDRQQACSERVLFAQEIEAKNIALQELDRIKDEFLKRTSHEFRTPLNGILCSIQLVLDGLCDDRDEEIELLQQANQSSMHLLQLIDELLDLNHLNFGNFSINLQSIDLYGCLTKALYLQLPNLQQKHLKLVKHYSSDRILVHADPIRLTQVFVNTIGNAIKFTDRGSITISTEVQVREHKGSKPELFGVVTIRDTGIGIDPKFQEKMFEAFMMEDGSLTRSYGGNGLGLTISEQFVKRMGGDIRLTSPGKGKGATVTITIPIATDH